MFFPCVVGVYVTRILKMEMKGFKSFANKTELLFGESFNCVLGPNGSGKSNVFDALCFVLGKAGAKGLRVEKSSNLVYNGGKTKKPAKEGEVSIWFDNSEKEFPSIEEDAVKITRIIKQTGQGVYRINDKVSTRTQILDLLSMAHINPDGYNIILQGDIIRLIEMSSVERRGIFEEIAGINIYEDKRKKAVRELERVEAKLNDADIILAERESYLKELKKDRDKAQKYKDLEEKRRRNKKTLITDGMKEKQTAIDKYQKLIDTNNAKIEKIDADVKKLRELIAEKKKETDALNKEIESKGEKEQVAVHKKVEQLKVDVALKKQRIQTLDGELEKLSKRKEELEASKAELTGKTSVLSARKTELEKQIKNREEDLKSIDEKILAFKKKNNLEVENSTDERISEIDAEFEKIQMEMNDLREKQQNFLREKDKVELQLQTIDDKLAKLSGIKEENKKELEKLQQTKKEFKQATLDLSKELSKSSEYASQLSNARSKLLSREEELAKLEAKKSALFESMAGSRAIKAVLDLKKNDPSIKGTVAELGTVDKKFGQALEVAAGGKIKSIIVETDQSAAKCISFLKKDRLGTATFIPLNKIRSAPISEQWRNYKAPGVHGLAIDLIKFNPQYKKAFEYVFGNTLVVDDIETARRLGIGKIRMVTLTGDIVELSGAMQGGFRQQKKAGGLFAQDDVNQKITALESEIGDLQNVIATLSHKSKESEEFIHRLRSLKAELEGEIIKTEKSLHLDSDDAMLDSSKKEELQKRNAELDGEIDEIFDQISEKNRTLAQLKIERGQLRDKLSELRNPAKLAELRSFEEKKNELSREIIELRGDLKHTLSEMDTIVGPEERRIIEIVKQHEKDVHNFVKEKDVLEKQMIGEEKDLAQFEKKQAAFIAQFKELFQKREKLSNAINDAEIKISKLNTEEREIELKNNAYALENARYKAELAGLQEEDKDYTNVEPYTNKARDVIKRELAQFERMTADLGAVNMRALEIYEEVAQEYKSLTEKKETLRKERESVLLMMNEIDSKKKELFLKTFNALQTNFQKIFKTIISKGDASLVLEDENDPFNGGVVIKVRLTGKRFMDIRSLSGGEKTMAALAFLFAVQEYDPASFYIMDEVDAALDKKNSEKLAELIRSYCSHAQYIVISHNDGVIEEADNLYGVSMNEHGMSKVTAIKL